MNKNLEINYKTNSFLYDVSLNKKFSYDYLDDIYGFQALTSKEKKPVFLIADNSIEFIISYVNLLKENFLLILINKNISKEQLEKLIKVYEPYLICMKSFGNLSFKNYKIEKKIFRSAIFKRKNKFSYNIHDLNKLLLSTSGTTGSSKFVRLSLENLNFNSNSIIKSLNIKKNHTTITTLPSDYTLGLSVINTHLKAGSSIVLNEYSFFEKKFWDLIDEKKVNSFTGVPISFEILKKIDFKKFNLNSIKYISQAGGAISEEMHKYMNNICEKKKIKFFPMYGSTEATARISILDWKFRKKIGSVGKPLDQTSVKLIQNKKIFNRILFKGKNVSLGYAKNLSDLKNGNINKGKVLMDDIGKIDKDGFLYILGKKSRFVKLHGLRINLDEIQDLLASLKILSKCVFKNNKLIIFLLNKKLINRTRLFIIKNLKINPIHFKINILKNFPINKNKKVDLIALENYES